MLWLTIMYLCPPTGRESPEAGTSNEKSNCDQVAYEIIEACWAARNDFAPTMAADINQTYNIR
jgi:hypothetical protein